MVLTLVVLIIQYPGFPIKIYDGFPIMLDLMREIAYYEDT
jgi:hypothetical protein